MARLPKKKNRFIGTKRKDKITATNGMDLIIGNGGADVINARGGDDLIDPSRWTGGGYDVVRTGKGYDTIILEDDYWVEILDFNIKKDTLDLRRLNEDWNWDYFKGSKTTYIFNHEEDEVARFKGFVDLANADIIWD